MSASPRSSVFQVKDIVGHRQTSGKDYYLVHWLGYSTKDNTWEPFENLLNCKDLIDSYMEQEVAEERRKSLRVRPTPTRDTAMLSSDDEIVVSGATRRKSLRPKKAASPAKNTVSKRVSSSASSSKQSVQTRSYYLRSTDFSSDEDSGAITRSSQRSTTRMSLSESRFRRQLADIKQGKFPSPQRTTSTPQKGGQSRSPKSKQPASPPRQTEPASTKVQAKTRLLFVNSQSKASPSVLKSSMVTRQQLRKLEDEVTVAEADESEPETPPPYMAQDNVDTPALKKSSPDVANEEQCFPVTWKEFALAAFVTGIAAVGYVCYTTDYCGYC